MNYSDEYESQERYGRADYDYRPDDIEAGSWRVDARGADYSDQEAASRLGIESVPDVTAASQPAPEESSERDWFQEMLDSDREHRRHAAGRLAAGADSNDVELDLQANLSRLPGKLKPDDFFAPAPENKAAPVDVSGAWGTPDGDSPEPAPHRRTLDEALSGKSRPVAAPGRSGSSADVLSAEQRQSAGDRGRKMVADIEARLRTEHTATALRSVDLTAQASAEKTDGASTGDTAADPDGQEGRQTPKGHGRGGGPAHERRLERHGQKAQQAREQRAAEKAAQQAADDSDSAEAASADKEAKSPAPQRLVPGTAQYDANIANNGFAGRQDSDENWLPDLTGSADGTDPYIPTHSQHEDSFFDQEAKPEEGHRDGSMSGLARILPSDNPNLSPGMPSTEVGDDEEWLSFLKDQNEGQSEEGLIADAVHAKEVGDVAVAHDPDIARTGTPVNELGKDAWDDDQAGRDPEHDTSKLARVRRMGSQVLNRSLIYVGIRDDDEDSGISASQRVGVAAAARGIDISNPGAAAFSTANAIKDKAQAQAAENAGEGRHLRRYAWIAAGAGAAVVASMVAVHMYKHGIDLNLGGTDPANIGHTPGAGSTGTEGIDGSWGTMPHPSASDHADLMTPSHAPSTGADPSAMPDAPAHTPGHTPSPEATPDVTHSPAPSHDPSTAPSHPSAPDSHQIPDAPESPRGPAEHTYTVEQGGSVWDSIQDDPQLKSSGLTQQQQEWAVDTIKDHLASANPDMNLDQVNAGDQFEIPEDYIRDVLERARDKK